MPRFNDPGAALRKACEPASRAAWENVNPDLPFDLTEEEAKAVVLVNGRARLSPEHAEARSGRRAAA